jgi:hypothetical protein
VSNLTDCGLPGIRDIPYGVHMCHFYEGRDELAGVLVPYFAAGLAARERCIWITAEPLRAAQAGEALRRAGVDVDGAVAAGALTIRDFSSWYAEAGSLLGNDVIDLWLGEERRALAAGYSGLRITGNVTFLRAEDWPQFMEYEALINQAFEGRRIVTLCTYQRSCGAAEMLEASQRHTCALDHPDEGWQILTAG